MITNNYPVLFIFGLVVYIGIMIAIAYFSSKKGSTEGEGYLMGGAQHWIIIVNCDVSSYCYWNRNVRWSNS